jgi:hypothetical protein
MKGGTADISRSPMEQLLSYKERLYWINSFSRLPTPSAKFPSSAVPTQAYRSG